MARGVLTTPASGFRLDRTAPAPDLAGLVDLHWHVRWDLPPGAAHVQGVLPFPCVNLGHGSDGPFVAGPVSGRDDRTLSGRGHALGTRIAAGLFPTLTTLPAHVLTDRTVTFAEAFGPDGARLEETLAAAPGPAEHRAAVEAFLRARVVAAGADATAAQHRERGRLANRVVTAIIEDAEPGRTSVADVAAHHGMTTRGLQRLFRDYVGLTPKQVLQRARLHEAVERVAARSAGAADLAYDLGYADQSHFTNAFKHATGKPPGRY
jgi:AraC-like DNA-binding protein